MMKMIRLSLPFIILLISACANNPYDSPKEINEACRFEMQAALTAIKLRNKDKPKSNLLAKLTPLEKNSSRLLVNMYQIVDEVYSHVELNETIYPRYRFELCQRQLSYKSYPLTIEPVLPMLKRCQQQFGSDSPEQATTCIVKGLDTDSNEKPD